MAALQKPALPDTLEKIVALARKNDQRILAFNLENYVQVVTLQPPHFEYALTEKAPTGLGKEMLSFLNEYTGEKWTIEQKNAVSTPTLKEQKEEKKQNQILKMQKDPLIAQILTTFPRSKITSIQEVINQTEEPDEQTENFF